MRFARDGSAFTVPRWTMSLIRNFSVEFPINLTARSFMTLRLCAPAGAREETRERRGEYGGEQMRRAHPRRANA